ncbi:sensor histidine kinase [Gloeobacter kilaueensis]|uniref:histidine kinase n=1 Tax=Gloeobacter kilaueensis (strain ATCC BAA-2537 / CCAP 1431/1 / ULC 316 / JS1) TaxID=1183438 RepID=U5QSI3_GLOK1|nr:ATP-binding protein [Gloeobacter kilaueensis]AGY60695.1 multi-sensor signal transduction histidine kinase [Gloeobacter kilaueensis JS1]
MLAEHEILNCLPFGLVVTDRRGKILLWNEAMASLTGVRAPEAEGSWIYDWSPELPHNGHGSVCWQTTAQQHLHLNVLTAESAQGHKIWTFLQEAHQELDQAQADFVSTVSHELRTPLTSIKGFIDTLLRSGSQLSEAQHRRFLRIIKNQADRLTRLVEDILTVSKIQSGRLKNLPQRLELAEIVDRVVENLSQKFTGNPMLTELPADLPRIWADQDRLEQILTNLIDNALKYSEAGSPVQISAHVDPEDPNVLWIAVRDRGIGIPEGHLDQIFNRFSRIDSPLTREREGTGLGLYITKSLVESLGGSISVESQYGVGSVFTISLPAAHPGEDRLDA